MDKFERSVGRMFVGAFIVWLLVVLAVLGFIGWLIMTLLKYFGVI
jgi:hypothetical protein